MLILGAKKLKYRKINRNVEKLVKKSKNRKFGLIQKPKIQNRKIGKARNRRNVLIETLKSRKINQKVKNSEIQLDRKVEKSKN